MKESKITTKGTKFILKEVDKQVTLYIDAQSSLLSPAGRSIYKSALGNLKKGKK